MVFSAHAQVLAVCKARTAKNTAENMRKTLQRLPSRCILGYGLNMPVAANALVTSSMCMVLGHVIWVQGSVH